MNSFRTRESDQIRKKLKNFPIVGILGPRQIGKTSLAKSIPHTQRFDLENPRDAMVLESPQTVLERLDGLVILDEIQRKPDLFPLLRYLVDEDPKRRYLILGSASPQLIQESSESLAGRISYLPLAGFSLTDFLSYKDDWERYWLRGYYPKPLLMESDEESFEWMDQYIATFLNQDIPLLGIRIASSSLFRFWSMIAHYHGQTLNYSELSRSFGVSDFTIRRYLEILEGTFMIRLLSPWQHF